MLKRALGNIVLVCVSLGFSLLFAELLLSQFIPLKNNGKFDYRIPHPQFGWVLEPNAQYNYVIPEATVPVTYNADGWRDVKHRVDNSKDIFRTLVLGDSFMEAYSVDLTHAFPRKVESIARHMGAKMEVVNLSVAGYGTLQEYLVYQEIGQAYAPDIILLGFYIANDVANNSAELESLVNPHSLKTDSRPFLDPDDPKHWNIKQVDFEGARRRYDTSKARRGTILEYFEDQWVLGQLAVKATKRIPGIISRMLSGSPSSRFLGLHGASYCNEPVAYTRAWKTTSRILARLQQETRAVGSTLVVFSVPSLQDLNGPYREKVEAKAPHPNTLCFDQAPGYRKLANILDEHDIEFVDLLPEFRKVSNEGIDLFWKSDRHWNLAGHELAAQRVVAALWEEGLLPEKAKLLPRPATPTRHPAHTLP